MGKARSPGGVGSNVNSMGILRSGGKGHVGLTEYLNDFVGTTQGANADSRLLREFTSNNWTNLMADPANVQRVNDIIDNNLPNQWNGGPTYRGINVSDADLDKFNPTTPPRAKCSYTAGSGCASTEPKKWDNLRPHQQHPVG